MKPFFVYMLECSDGSFYVGHTDDLEDRIAQHESGVFDGHTAARRPVRLVWSAELETRDEAFGLERQLKGWSRAKKRALIEGDWGSVRALAAPRTGPDLRESRRVVIRPRPAPVHPERGPDRSCFDRLSTSGDANTIPPDLSPARPELVEGRVNGDPQRTDQPPARPEPVEGRAAHGPA